MPAEVKGLLQLQGVYAKRKRLVQASSAGASHQAKETRIFLHQLKQVAWLLPALRQISATGTPSSACFRMNAF